MKKKIILFLFAFLFLPGVIIFSACGKEKVKLNGFSVYINDVIFSQNNNTINLDYGDTEDWKDLITVKQTFSNGKEEKIAEKTTTSDGYTITITPEKQTLNADTYTVVINYANFSSVTITMIVDRLSVAKPTAIEGLEYNGTTQKGVNYLTNAGYSVIGDTTHTEAGEHTATFTLDENHKWSDGSTDPVVVSWTIDKKKVFVPQIMQLPYNGEKQTAGELETEFYTATDNGGTEVGEYNVELTLKDSDNYYFDGDTTKNNETITIKYNIIQARNAFIDTLSLSGWTYKDATISTPCATAKFGEVKFAYFSDEDCEDEITISNLTDAGTYYVLAYVEETSNYTALESDVVSFTISRKVINNKPEFEGSNNFEYNGSEQSPTIINYDEDCMEIIAGSVISAKDVSDEAYSITYRLKDNYIWSDTTNDDVTLSWYINKQRVSAPAGNNIVYEQDQEVESIIEFDDAIIEMVAAVEGYETTEDTYGMPGTYNFILKLKDNANYEWDYNNIESIDIGGVVYLIYTWHLFEVNPFSEILMTTVEGKESIISYVELLGIKTVEFGTKISITTYEGFILDGDSEFEFINEGLEIYVIDEEGNAVIQASINPKIDTSSVIESVIINSESYTYSEFLNIENIEFKSNVQVVLHEKYKDAGYTSNYSTSKEFTGESIKVSKNANTVQFYTPICK